MDEIGRIFLSWRTGPGARRFIIGLLKRNMTDGATFSYLLDGVKAASKEGFKPYIDFPNPNKVYSENVLEIFGQRLMKFERGDSYEFLNFWGLDKSFNKDKYYLLAHTQGWLPTDMFEFLAEFYPVKNLSFVSELAALSHNVIATGQLRVGDMLKFTCEPANEFDKEAVYVSFDGKKIGYIKKIHNRIFYKPRAEFLKIRVKSLEQSDTIKKIFVHIYI